jgi:hypothetical protein
VWLNPFNELVVGWGGNPAYRKLIACGYDPECYISTAQIAPSPYVSLPLVQARIGGIIKLIEACDDSVPPVNNLTGPALAVYNSVVQNVTTEINGYLSSIYPIPLVQTGTVCILRITGISSDGNGTITSLEIVNGGNYLTPPAEDNSPVYLRHFDNSCQDWSWEWQCQQGSGAVLEVAFTQQPYSDESGQVLQMNTVTVVPTITGGGTNYQCGQLLVLVGGTSVVPAKVREASLILICHSLYQRRIAPDEKNLFADLAKMWRKFFMDIGEGEAQLDGTYKRFFTPATSWNTESVLNGADSL